MTRMWRIAITCGSAAAAALASAPAVAVTQDSRIRDRVEQLDERRGELARVLYDVYGGANGEGPCDLDRFRNALIELGPIVDELKAIAEAAETAGEMSTVNPQYAQSQYSSARFTLRSWTAALPDCERRSALSAGGSSGPAEPPSDVPAPPPAQVPPSLFQQALTVQQVQVLAPLTAALDIAIGNCDRAAFRAAKNRLLEAIGRMISRSPNDPALLAERRRIEETQFPQPCPPDSRTSFNDPAGSWGYPPGFFAGLAFGRVDVPQTGIGFMRDGPFGDVPEGDAALTEETINWWQALIGGQFFIPGTDTIMQIGGSWSEGNASNSFDASAVPDGAAGSVYGALSPGGSSGISGQTTISGLADVEMSELRLRAELGLLAGGAYNVGWYADYSHVDRDHELSLSGTAIANPSLQFAQERSQNLDEDYFGTGVSGELRVPLSTNVLARLSGSVGAYHLASSLHSTELNINNFSGGPDASFTIDIRDSQNGFGIMSDAGAGLEFRLGPGLSILAEGTVGYRSRVGAIFNPNSGDQVFLEGRTTELTTDDSWRYGVGVSLLVNFRM